MKIAPKFVVTVCALVLLAGIAAQAQNQFVFSNNGNAPGIGPGPLGTTMPNTVSAFSVAPEGTLTQIPGSPFFTGGMGIRLPQGFLNDRVLVGPVRHFLYVSNVGSNDVSVFAIDPASGFLSPVPGSPFATGGDGSNGGIVLQTTPDEKLLFAANRNSTDISVFSVGDDGVLTLLGPPIAMPGVPKPQGLAAIKVTPDGKFLAAAFGTYPNDPGNPSDLGAVGMFRIGSDGSLVPVPGSPFAEKSAGYAGGIDINCGGNFAFVADVDGAMATPTKVDVFRIGRDGVLTNVNSIQLSDATLNSTVARLSADDSTLYINNQTSNTITAFSVSWDGALTLVPGSPFAAGALRPAGMAVNRLGTQLYAASYNPTAAVLAFNISDNGALAPVAGSPYFTGSGNGMMSVAAYPPKSCVLIAVKPGDEESVINPHSNGTIAVAILSSGSFDALTVDTATLTFGRTGIEDSLAFCNPYGEDVNKDGKVDLMCHFRTRDTGLREGDDGVILQGKTIDGAPFTARDWIRVTTR